MALLSPEPGIKWPGPGPLGRGGARPVLGLSCSLRPSDSSGGALGYSYRGKRSYRLPSPDSVSPGPQPWPYPCLWALDLAQSPSATPQEPLGSRTLLDLRSALLPERRAPAQSRPRPWNRTPWALLSTSRVGQGVMSPPLVPQDGQHPLPMRTQLGADIVRSFENLEGPPVGATLVQTDLEMDSAAEKFPEAYRRGALQADLRGAAERVEALITFGEGLAQRSEPGAWAALEQILRALGAHRDTIFRRLWQLQAQLVSYSLVFEEANTLDQDLEIEGDSDWPGPGGVWGPWAPSSLPTSAELEWDPAGDIGGLGPLGQKTARILGAPCELCGHRGPQGRGQGLEDMLESSLSHRRKHLAGHRRRSLLRKPQGSGSRTQVAPDLPPYPFPSLPPPGGCHVSSACVRRPLLLSRPNAPDTLPGAQLCQWSPPSLMCVINGHCQRKCEDTGCLPSQNLECGLHMSEQTLLPRAQSTELHQPILAGAAPDPDTRGQIPVLYLGVAEEPRCKLRKGESQYWVSYWLLLWAPGVPCHWGALGNCGTQFKLVLP
uniref:nesprin-4 isoform X2 n=1 Tax=Callithrix jacchus TaxID=9483 RepID=UPI00159E2F20|nr:nesprin-4 isoform X2 [Callithrix jacchus]